MVITRLEDVGQSKIKVYIDYQYAFLLYQKDIEKLELAEGIEISRVYFETILEDTILRRAKQKAIAILKFMDRTELELRTKLIDAGYPEAVVEQTINYVSEYGFLNDERFVSAYVRAKMHTKSKRVIKTELQQKGIPKDIIEQIFSEEYEEDGGNEDAELIAIRKSIAKKTKKPETLTYEEKQRLMASLYRKGFQISKIKQLLS
jgi:regulatory protein